MKNKSRKQSKILRVIFQSLDNLGMEVIEKLNNKETMVDSEEGVVRFENIQAYRKFMSMTKIEIIGTIRSKKPESIYQLASLIDRSFSATLKDCQALKNTGFIVIEKKMDGSREIHTPKLSFDYDEILIENTDKINYKISWAA
jgi:predicted transcriptional regulator